MKKVRLMLLALVALLGKTAAQGETVNNYIMNLDTPISTSFHDFALGSNWGHIVGTYDDDGEIRHMSYSYSASGGVDGTGALLAYRQYVLGQSYGSGGEVYDLLVSPLVSGTITLDAKLYQSDNSFVEFYKVTGTPGAYVYGEKISAETVLNTESYSTISFELAEETRVGIRASYAYIDNFTASSATILPESKLTVTAVKNSEGTTSTTYFGKNADGTVTLNLQVTLQNTGDVDLKAGDEHYSVSPVLRAYYGSTLTYFNDITFAVTKDIAAGQSATIPVEFTLPSSVETGWVYIRVKENITNTVSDSQLQSNIQAYESKFVFREAGTTATSSLSGTQSWGTITEPTARSYEIFNNGTAPLTVNSITLPEGFSSSNMPTAAFELDKGASRTFDITLDAATMGTFAGTLTINYTNALAEMSTDYKLDFSATVISANTWTADFNNTSSTIVYPAGSIAEYGASFSDYQSISGGYNNWIIGTNTASYKTDNNKFITPKLHAEAGATLAFDVKAGYSTSNDYSVKVYVSADRKTWGEPVAYYTYTDNGEGSEGIGSSFVTKAVTFDTAGDYYVAFALYGSGSGIDNIIGLEKVDVAHDLYIKEVTWPNSSVKSGVPLTRPSIDIIPLTDEAATNYTVKYVYGDQAAVIASKPLTASAKNTTNFRASFTPVVESTTTFPATKVVFEFTDGTLFETEPFDLTVTNEPIFHFVNVLPSNSYEPSDRTAPITFGKTNSADTQQFFIYNWGSAKLNVKSISLPDGFTTTTEFPLEIAAFNGENSGIAAASQPLDITFSADEAGEYGGDMVITYVDGSGADATFTLGISGTKLAPDMFYANFDDGNWPAGSVSQHNVSMVNGGTTSAPNYYINSSSTTDNIFVTPKLVAAAGDKLSFDAKLYSSGWSEGKVAVYAAATRDEVLNAEEGSARTLLFSVSGQDASHPLTTDYQTFEVTIPSAGEYFLGFELSGRPCVDELYGLKVAEVAHDLAIASSHIPTESMQNTATTAIVNILNLGIADEAADSYTITAYVDGEAAATGEAVSIPMNHKFTDAGTQLSVSFRTPKTGTLPVYVELTADDYSIATEPVDVTFAEEQAAVGLTIGEVSSISYDNGFVYNNDKNSESVSLYSASMLSQFGLNAGDKITKIAYRGYKTTDSNTSSLKIWYEWTDDIIQSQPAATAYDTEGMTVLVDEAAHVWEKAGSSTSLVDMLSIDLSASPIVCQANKGLRIVVRNEAESYKSFYIETTDVRNAYRHNSDYASYATDTWRAKNLAVLHLEKEVTTATLAGTVSTSAGEGIEGATVKLAAHNGVGYSGTTDANGAYSFSVIQAGLDFTVTVEGPGYLKRQFALNMGGESMTRDVTLYKQIGIVGDAAMGLDWDEDAVMTQDEEDANIFTLVKEATIEAAGTYYYKLRADGDWNLVNKYELPNEGNNNWYFGKAGTYTLKFTADMANHTLTLELPYTLAEDAEGVADLAWVTVDVEREFKAGWNAVVLPFALSTDEVAEAFGENSELAVYVGDEGTGTVTVKFKKISGNDKYISAGYPYLLWLESPVSGLKFTKDISPVLTTAEGSTFNYVGVYAKTTVMAGDYFVKGGEFVRATTNNSVLPFRAYLKLRDGATARAINVIITDGDETTSIDAAEVSGLDTEGVYNLQGQKVENLNRKGLYIVNGKKVYVK